MSKLTFDEVLAKHRDAYFLGLQCPAKYRSGWPDSPYAHFSSYALGVMHRRGGITVHYRSIETTSA